MERFDGSDPATQALRITDFRENDNIRGFSILLKSRAEYSISQEKKRNISTEILLLLRRKQKNCSTAISFLQTKCLTFGLLRDILLTARNHLSASMIIEKRIFLLVVVWYSVVHDGTNTRVRYAHLWNFKRCSRF